MVCLNYKQLNDVNKAKEYYAEMKAQYPNDELTIHSMILLGEVDGDIPREAADKKEISGNKDGALEYSLFENYPNPFNPATTISYTLPQDGKVIIKVFDVLGREVTTLVNEFTTAGKHNVVWDGTNFASGIYFYSITFKGETLNKKMLLVK